MHLFKVLKNRLKTKRTRLLLSWLLPSAFVLLSRVLWASKALAEDGVDTTEAVNQIQQMVVPAVRWATDWGTKVGFGIVASQLFYTIVIRLVKD